MGLPALSGPALLPAAAGASEAAALQPGAAAPYIRLPGLAGPVDLAAWAGQVVYVDFWASWCGPCRLSFPWMNALHDRHGGKGLQVLAVNLDVRRADADRFLAAMPARFHVAFDPQGDTPRRWQVKTMPSSTLVGRDGRLLWLHRGFRPDDAAALEARVVDALATR
jgi:cytochrome c biogenesis protein CcmG, thiol:disulfide interchange protein DsbE